MRRVFALLAVVPALLLVAAASSLAAATPLAHAARTPQQTLTKALQTGIRAAGNASGALVVDLNTGNALFSDRSGVGRLPASVEKLYTTSTALTRFGPNRNLLTKVFGVGALDASGTWHGTLYIRGGGDPTFGSASFDNAYYGTGATMQRLVADLIRQTGIKAVSGNIAGDEGYFDSLRGTAATGYQASSEVEGLLSGLAYDRGYTSSSGTAFQSHPALFAAQQFASALRAAHVNVPKRIHISSGVVPAGASLLADVHSPRMATLLRLTNAPSDNFLAEMLLKDLGASFGNGGTSAAGAAVVRAQVASSFGIHPRLDDGSGLSRYDSTSPIQVVTLLERMATNAPFLDSLAVAGETGTLQFEMQRTAAQGKCRGKTGTLSDVSNLVGYCTARDGHTLAFAFLMNSIDPNSAHPIQDQMAVALAKYSG
jgi:D-alanyl-D-alanine carboxypeptidase/D-alanyl-D-alanine-endopeptidase (penicillin-binding protein 4)